MISFESVTLFTHEKKTIVEDVSFTINNGEKTVLTGPSGCGKSSLLRTASAGFENWAGKVVINSSVLTPKSAPIVRKLIGYIPQEPRMPEGTVIDFMKTFLNSAGTVFKRENAVLLFTKLNLSEKHLDSEILRLSGGERQRVVIAAVLLLRRDIILADEITSALDAESKAAVIDLILNSKATVLSVSHDPAWLEQCERKIDVSAFGGTHA